MPIPTTAVYFNGFEDYWSENGGSCPTDGQRVYDILKARSGVGYHRVYAPSLDNPVAVNPDVGPVAAGSGVARCRTFLRLWTSLANDRPVFKFRVGNASANHIGVALGADNKIFTFFTQGTVITESAARTTNACPVGDWDGWVQIDWTGQTVENGVGAGQDRILSDATVTFPNGQQEALSLPANTWNNLGTMTFGLGQWIGSTAPFVSSTTGEYHLDDLWMAFSTNGSTPAFPAGTRIVACQITGQGSEADWTNGWERVAKPTAISTADYRQEASSAGLRTVFTHQTAADLGITGDVYGLMLKQAATLASSSTTAKFRIGGTTYDRGNLIDTALRDTYWYCHMETMAAATFDALEYGVESNHGSVVHRLYAMNCEVLHDGLAKAPIHLSLGNGYKHKWVTYTGDGTYRKVVTGVGFRPQFVMVVPFNQIKAVHTRHVALPFSMAQTGARDPQEIISLDSDGFSVGNGDMNVSGQTYAALCVRDDGSLNGSDYEFQFRAGSITMNAQVEAFSHSAASLLKALFMVPSETAAGGQWWMHTADIAPLSAQMSSSAAPANISTVLNANGFNAGTSTGIHNGSGWGLWFGWVDTADLSKFLQVGEIAPATVDTQVTISGFTDPLYMVWGRGNNSVTGGLRLNEAVYSGVLCSQMVASGAITLPDRLIALTDTTFTVDGTTGAMLTGSVECWWVAIARDGEVLPATESTIPDVEGPVGLTWVELTDSSAMLNIWSTVALPDPPTYYGGFKEARVTKFGTIRRSLSDDLGQYEGIDFTFTLDDSDRRLRGMLDAVSTRYFPNRPVVVRTITDELRRVQSIPRTILRGLVRLYRPAKNLLFDFTVQDSLASKFSLQSSTNQIPKRLITLADFPNCPQAPGATGGANAKTYTTPHPSIPIPPCPGYVQLSDQAGARNLIGDISNGTYGLCEARGWIGYDGSGVVKPAGSGWILPLLTGDVYFASPDVATALEAGAGGGTTDLVTLSLPVPIIYGSISDLHITDGVDAGNGQCPALYVGAETLSDARSYHKFVLCGHAVESIDGIYADNGATGVGTSPASQIGDLAVVAGAGGDWVVPGYANWTALKGAAPYEDINGNRYTVVYGLVGNHAADVGAGFFPPLNDTSVRLAFSVHGIETNGDGTGTLITDLLSQYLHCLQNWVFGDYRSGAWLASPTFPDDAILAMIDDASFTAASAVANRRVVGGYRGDFILGSSSVGKSVLENLSASDRVSVRELVARFNVSADVNSGFNRKGQFFVSMIDDADFNIASVMNMSDVSHVHKDSFDVFDDQAHHWNVVPYRHTQDYFRREKDGWRSIESGETEVLDSFSITQYGPPGNPLRLTAPMLFLYMVRGYNRSSDYAGYAQGTATAQDVVGRFLMRHKDPPRLATLQVGMVGHNVDLGDVVRLTHYAGIGAAGWVDRPLRVLRHEASPGEYTVDLQLFDLQTLFATGFILGDETALPALWTSATAAQRFYGYLGDEATGTFSDGQPMKRVR